MEQQELTTSNEMNQQFSPENLTSQLGVNEDCSHIDSLLAEFSEIEEVSHSQNLISSGSLIDKQGFRVIFFGGAQIGQSLKPDYESLQMLSDDNSQAIMAIDTLHDCIMDIPQLHWLLNPGGKWAQRGFAIGSFFIPFGISLYKDVKKAKSCKSTVSNLQERPIKQHETFDISNWEDSKH